MDFFFHEISYTQSKGEQSFQLKGPRINSNAELGSWRECSSHIQTSNALPIKCPVIQPNSDALYLETMSDPTG